jgi:hypothetical protein
MRTPAYFWILLGMFIAFTYPAAAEFSFDKIMMKIDSSQGEKAETDFYCYSDWKSGYFKLDLTNKFSWPESNENFSRFNVKADFEKYKQLKMDFDYQWNDRYRILGPTVAYNFKFKSDFVISLEYGTENRDPLLDKDLKLKYHIETGTVKMALDKKNWSYDLKLIRTGKDYPKDQIKNYTRDQLSQRLAWKIQPDLNFRLSYYETSCLYSNVLKISQERWNSKVGLSGDYHINEYWQIIGSFNLKEEEKGLIPYLAQQDWELKLKNKFSQDLTIDLRVKSVKYDYYSDITYFDPDEMEAAEEDRKSRIENKAVVECSWRLKESNLEVETGLFWVFKDYYSFQVSDYKQDGIYTSLLWKPNRVGLGLEIAPNGNLSRTRGFYQLKIEYYF